MRRRFLLVVLLTAAHFLLSLATIVASHVFGMARPDSGESASAVERMIDAASAILLFPLVHALAAWAPRWMRPSGPPWEHLVFLANSLLCAIAITWILLRWRTSRAQRMDSAVARARG